MNLNIIWAIRFSIIFRPAAFKKHLGDSCFWEFKMFDISVHT